MLDSPALFVLCTALPVCNSAMGLTNGQLPNPVHRQVKQLYEPVLFCAPPSLSPFRRLHTCLPSVGGLGGSLANDRLILPLSRYKLERPLAAQQSCFISVALEAQNAYNVSTMMTCSTYAVSILFFGVGGVAQNSGVPAVIMLRICPTLRQSCFL